MSEPTTPERILSAADELFGSLGYDGVSVRDIAEKAGVNKASVFYHYDSKDALFERVLDRYYTAHHEALEDVWGSVGDPMSRLHAVIDSYIDFMLANQRYPRLIVSMINAANPQHLEFIQRSTGSLFQWTERALADITPASGPLAARQFYLTISGAVTNTFIYAEAVAPWWGGEPLSPENLATRREHIHWLVDMCLEGLQRAQSGG
jgi:AcrR family transcriptional regulator